MIQKYLVANNTTKYIDELPRLIKLYISAICNIKPTDASKEENLFIIRDINLDKQKEKQKINKLSVKANPFRVGDLVRYKIEKGTFTKGYAITYSNNVHRIISITHRKAKFENLQKVPEGSGFLSTMLLQNTEKSAKRKRLLAKAGLL